MLGGLAIAAVNGITAMAALPKSEITRRFTNDLLSEPSVEGARPLRYPEIAALTTLVVKQRFGGRFAEHDAVIVREVAHVPKPPIHGNVDDPGSRPFCTPQRGVHTVQPQSLEVIHGA